jgi:hypothetical protein
MISALNLGLDGGKEPGPVYLGPRPFLTNMHMTLMRPLLVFYVLAFLFMAAMNVRSVGGAVFRLSAEHRWVALTVGIVFTTAVLIFLLLLGMSLYHFTSGHTGEKPAQWWLWVILLLNVAGVVAYYLRVIEPEQRALIRAQRAA